MADQENNYSYQYGSTNGLFGSNKKQKFDNEEIKNISSSIKAGSGKYSKMVFNDSNNNGNINFVSGDDTTLQIAKISADNDVVLNVGKNLNILTGVDVSSTSYINNDETTFNFSNGSSGNLKTKVINTEIIANDGENNPVINVGGGIVAQYGAKDYNKETGVANEKGVAYLKNFDVSKTIYNPVDEVYKSWDQTTRALNENGQAGVAVVAVAIAIGTGGIGSGISGAMMTAAATTAATTATISATNASMNADGNLLGSLDDVGKTTFKDTTSEESFKNMAISAAVAGAAAWAVQASGGSTSLEQGKDYAVYKPDPSEMVTNSEYRTFVETNYPNYNGVIDPSVNNIGMANTNVDYTKIGTPVPAYSTNPFTSSFWEGFLKESGFISNGANKLGGMNAMSTMHDPWGENIVIGTSPILQISIAPAIGVQYCATFPAACGAVVSGSMNNDFGTKK